MILRGFARNRRSLLGSIRAAQILGHHDRQGAHNSHQLGDDGLRKSTLIAFITLPPYLHQSRAILPGSVDGVADVICVTSSETN